MSPQSRVDLSVIVVNWNTRDLLLRCLQSVFTTLRELAFEVVVVDNASIDGSASIAQDRFPNTRWIQNTTNVGFARANNQAIEMSAGRYVLLLNSDAELLANGPALALAFMDGQPRVGIVGGKLLNPDRSFQASYNDDPSFLSEILTTAGLTRWIFGKYYPSHLPEQSTLARAVNWVGGACLIARRAAIDQVGLLDESLFMYSEELDWCYRFRQRGWIVYYLPELQAVHWGGQSSRPIEEKKLFWLTQGRVHFLGHYHGSLAVHMLQAGLRVIATLKAIAWLSIASVSGSRREMAWHKVRANWHLAKWNES